MEPLHESRKPDTVTVAVVGASGYTGGELLRLLAGHPRVTITAVTSAQSVGKPVSAVFPSLTSAIPLVFETLSPESVAKRADVVFLALPHTQALHAVATCVVAGRYVIDLSADYRIKDSSVYETWYKVPHDQPKLLEQAVYGLPEFHRDAIKTARLVAAPGCYPTAAILQLAPLVVHGLIEPSTIVIDAKSGVSGAGRSPSLPYHFPEAHESLEAYNIGHHRHIPEIEQELTWLASQHSQAVKPGPVVFTPHLVPMNRGILSTAYCRLVKAVSTEQLQALYREFYKGERFIRILDGMPANPHHVRGSNFCEVSICADQRTGWVVTVAALDNLVKGAAGQAIQCMNLMLGFPEEMGLTGLGIYP
jgi:N-acetyl-gamma-glutamyl-phosphate reductase